MVHWKVKSTEIIGNKFHEYKSKHARALQQKTC